MRQTRVAQWTFNAPWLRTP